MNPAGVLSYYRFAYIDQNGFFRRTEPLSAGNGTNAINVSVVVNDLVPKTGYSYHLISGNAFGFFDADSLEFTTLDLNSPVR